MEQIENFKISFIIPVYNGEKTIERCISSIQKCKESVEIIVINDGSNDKTEELCERIALTDSRLNIFTIQNSGQSIARNIGIKVSRGEYICFVDADDYIAAEKIENMWKRAKELDADIVMGSYIRRGNGEEKVVSLPGEGRIRKSGRKEEVQLYNKVKTSSAFGYVWNKLYKKSFLDYYQIEMDDIRKVYMEDTLFNLKVWSKNPNWFCIDIPFYYYEMVGESTTRRMEPLIHEKNVNMLKALIQYLQKGECLEENIDVLLPLIMRVFCWSLVKNVPYEGMSIEKIENRAKYFIEENMIQQVLRRKGALKSLTLLPSLVQTIFFGTVYILMRFKLPKMTAFIFWCLYPAMKIYIDKTVK